MRSSGKKRVETGDLSDKRIMNEIMLKFRPIAPRPVTLTSSVSMPLKEKRAKRKYVRVKKKKTNDDNNRMLQACNGSSEFVVTETDSIITTDPLRKVPIEWLSFDSYERNKNNNDNNNSNIATAPIDLHDVDLSTKAKRGDVVESWITVESVTGACEDWTRRCPADEEIWKDLEMDSCPCFISNARYEVKWVNLAYRKMVDLNSDREVTPPEVAVSLEVKMEKISMVEYWPAFSCRVRVVHRLSEKTKQMTVPCDVWKMNSGGYAWRLDVKVALSLGRLD